MNAVDTNVLVRLLAQDDPVQSPIAERFIEVAGPVWVSHLVLVQTLWVLSSVFELPRERIVRTVAALLENTDLHLEDEGAVARVLAHFRRSGKVDFTDCLILEIARAAQHLPLVTFDKALSRLPDTVHLPSRSGRGTTSQS